MFTWQLLTCWKSELRLKKKQVGRGRRRGHDVTRRAPPWERSSRWQEAERTVGVEEDRTVDEEIDETGQ